MPNVAEPLQTVILSEAKNPSLIVAIEERFFASLRMTNKRRAPHRAVKNLSAA
jgi:hypothetical protein